MPEPKKDLNERLQRLEREMVFLKSQGITSEESDGVLDELPQTTNSRRGFPWAGLFILILFLLVGWLVYRVESVLSRASVEPQRGAPFSLPGSP